MYGGFAPGLLWRDSRETYFFGVCGGIVAAVCEEHELLSDPDRVGWRDSDTVNVVNDLESIINRCYFGQFDLEKVFGSRSNIAQGKSEGISRNISW